MQRTRSFSTQSWLRDEGCSEKAAGEGMGGDANTDRGRREDSEVIINTAKEQRHVQELFCTVCRNYNCLHVLSWALSIEQLPQRVQTRLKTSLSANAAGRGCGDVLFLPTQKMMSPRVAVWNAVSCTAGGTRGVFEDCWG